MDENNENNMNTQPESLKESKIDNSNSFERVGGETKGEVKNTSFGEIKNESIIEPNANNTKNDQSIENMMISGLNNLSDIKARKDWWSMKDFNNCIEADRKLVVNNQTEFFVHDDVLNCYSDFFADLLSKSHAIDTRHAKEGDIKIHIEIPHSTKFFEILFWMYSRDSKRLKKAAKNFHDFLKLISLGIFLKMKPEFFEILLNKLAFQWKEEFFYDALWSRKVFTFPVLEKVVDEMKTNNFTKSVGNFNLFNFNSDDFLAS